MALPQGLNFRETPAFVTDGANEAHARSNLTGSATYPFVTAQGNTVGSVVATIEYDRNATVDRRLAGCINTPTAANIYRIDLPAAGTYNVRIAAGDAGFGNPTQWSVMDNTTLLATLTTGSITAGNFRDANNNVWSTANWPASNTPRQLTFTTTTLFIRSDVTSGNNALAHFYIEAATTGATINCAVGGAAAAGSIATINQEVRIASAVGNAAAAGSTATITNSSGATIACSVGNAAATGATASVSSNVNITCAVGNAAATGMAAAFSTRIMTDPLMNNTESILANTAVSWSWIPAGRIGALNGIAVTEGAGITDAAGRLAPGINVAAGVLMAARRNTNAADDDVFYQAWASA